MTAAHQPGLLSRDDAARCAAALLSAQRVLALTGAGISTDSGIPDYRGPNAVARTPMTSAEFRSGEQARRRYWARSHLGWQRIGQAQPNRGHLAMAALQREGAVEAVITQNVDGLHQRAGSPRVTDLHGRIDEVVCLDCGEVTTRARLHERFSQANPDFGIGLEVGVAPDGDAELDDTSAFVVSPCESCGGILKPNVVFFGENVRPEKVRYCYDLVEAADAMLVMGSSLAVMSGRRFVRHAYQLGKPVFVVNRGPTKADEWATVKIEQGCSEFLTGLLGAKEQALAG